MTLLYSEETITPAIAEQYLAKNTRNRNKKPLAIQRYSRDMASGKWRITGESIKFDTNGALCDGQNRLFAILDSCATIETAVTRGVAPEAMKVMDIVVPRSGADSLKLEGYNNAYSLQAAINAHAAYSSGVFRHCMVALGSAARLTNAEIVAYVEANPEIPEILTICNNVRKRVPMPIGSLVTAYYVLMKIDADATADFFMRIRDMVSSGKGDPIATLIQRIHQERMNRSKIEVSTGIHYLFRSWNAYRTNTPLQKFQIGTKPGWAPIAEPK